MKSKSFSFIVLSLTGVFFTAGFPRDEHAELRKIELLALEEAVIGKTYYRSIPDRKNCNKTRVKFLGLCTGKDKRPLKILTTFFVFPTSGENCHGTSKIKIFTGDKHLIGEYYVGMPENLPDSLLGHKLIYTRNSKDCPARSKGFIDLEKGIPAQFFLPCTEETGEDFIFSKPE